MNELTPIPQDEYVQQVDEAVAFLRQHINEKNPNFSPQAAIVLGSGLGGLAKLIEPVTTIPYRDIPHFPISTVPGHEGILIAGHLEGVPILGLKGRKHFYEIAHETGAVDRIVFPVHVARGLGCEAYIATNAAGGINPTFKVGDLMVIRTHIGLFFPNPLLGMHHDFGGNDYFQPQSTMYPQDLRDRFKAQNNSIKEGVYVAVTGRTFESQAEVLMLKMLGADAVGMSTVPEMIVAHNRGMKTLGVSIITNVMAEDGTNATSHEEVMNILNSKTTENKLLGTFQSFFRSFKS